MDQPLTTGRVDFDRAMKPFALPLGLASPMWLAYGAAASVGATWWWMSRLSRFASSHMADVIVAKPTASEAPALAFTPVEEAVESTVDAVETPVAAAAPEVEPIAMPATIETLVEQPDELTLLRGVGPRVADALVARGVTTFAQLAAWTDDELAAFDTEVKLLGRSKRYDFLGQAKDLSKP